MTSDPLALLAELPGPLDDAVAALPGAPGLHAWWAPTAVLAGWAGSVHPLDAGLRCLDVGAARMLRNRIRRQDLYRSGVSRLRRVLAGLLLEELALAPTWIADVVLPRADEDRLTGWMREHLQLTWCAHDTPLDVLDGLVDTLGPATATAPETAAAAEARFVAAAGEKTARDPGVLFRRP